MDDPQLKPLPELYGDGTGQSTIDPRSETFQPLLMSIEKAIVHYNALEDPSLTDGAALLVVKQLGMDPDREPADALGKRIHLAMRRCLHTNNYSRQDVKGCLRQVSKSIDRHNRVDGVRGYLDFIREFVG